MNILFVSNNSREATILAFELTKNMPTVQLQTVFDTQDALKELHESSGFGAIIFDSSVSRGDCSILTDAARQVNRRAHILFLLEPDTKEIPRALNDLGIDRFVTKRPGYGAVLAESLQQAVEAPRPAAAAPAPTGAGAGASVGAASAHAPAMAAAGAVGKPVRKVRVLYVGDEASELGGHVAQTQNLVLAQVQTSPDGSLNLPERGDAPAGDLVVIDAEALGAQTLGAVKSALLKAPDTPVVLLTRVGDEDTPTRAARAGAAVSVVKAGNYFQKLIPVIEKEVMVRDLAREKEIFKTRGSRLRQIVESLPVGVAQIAPSGTILAINQAGLRILGANNLNQVAGKNLLQLAPPDEREKILAFLSTVTGWAGASIRIAWKGLNGSSASLELRGTPLLRDPGGAACVLTTIHLTSSVVASPSKNEDLQQKCDALTQSLKVYEAQFKDLQQRFAAADQRCRALELAQQDGGPARASEAELAELRSARERLQSAEQAKGELESRLKERDEQLAISQEALDQAEARLAQKEEELHAEYGQKLSAAKEERDSLAQALESAESDKGSESERLKWEALRVELERRAQAAEEQALALQGELDEARGQILQSMSDAAGGDAGGWAEEKRELEGKLRAVEKERNTLAASLTGADSARKRRPDDVAAVEAKYEKRLAELERRCKAAEEECAEAEAERDGLGNELRRLQERLDGGAAQMDGAQARKLAEKYETERVEQRRTIRELEEKVRNVEAQRLAAQIALKDAENRVAELSIRRSSDADGADAELESKYRAVDEQRATLQAALKDTESRLAELIEKYNGEKGEQLKARRDLELKLQAAEAQKNAVQAALQDSIEKQHSALADALRSTENNVSQLTEKYVVEISDLEAAQKKAEQRLQEAERMRASLHAELQDAKVRIEELSRKYDAAEAARAELEREQAEAESTAAVSVAGNLRCQRLSQYTAVGMALADRNGFVIECNDIAARMFGYEGAEDALGRTGKERFRLYAFTGSLGRRLEEEGKLEGVGWTFQAADGRLIQIQEYATLVPQAGGGEPVVERILMDISQSHLRGEEIRHMRKLESAGDLALATIQSFQDLCASLTQSSEQLLATAGDNEVKRLAEAIRLKASRGIKYANRFISASHKTEKTPSLLNFNEVITDNGALLHNLTGEDIDLQMALEPQLGWIAAERSEAIQLVGNIMTSARESLPLGGILTIETANVETAGGGEDEPPDLPSGTYVRASFGIDGVAAQPERRNASVRSAVDRLGGWLATTNDPKKGNVFVVYLPRVEVFSSAS